MSMWLTENRNTVPLSLQFFSTPYMLHTTYVWILYFNIAYDQFKIYINYFQQYVINLLDIFKVRIITNTNCR